MNKKERDVLIQIRKDQGIKEPTVHFLEQAFFKFNRMVIKSNIAELTDVEKVKYKELLAEVSFTSDLDDLREFAESIGLTLVKDIPEEIKDRLTSIDYTLYKELFLRSFDTSALYYLINPSETLFSKITGIAINTELLVKE